jgi:hypothetical protein
MAWICQRRFDRTRARLKRRRGGRDGGKRVDGGHGHGLRTSLVCWSEQLKPLSSETDSSLVALPFPGDRMLFISSLCEPFPISAVSALELSSKPRGRLFRPDHLKKAERSAQHPPPFCLCLRLLTVSHLYPVSLSFGRRVDAFFCTRVPYVACSYALLRPLLRTVAAVQQNYNQLAQHDTVRCGGISRQLQPAVAPSFCFDRRGDCGLRYLTCANPTLSYMHAPATINCRAPVYSRCTSRLGRNRLDTLHSMRV